MNRIPYALAIETLLVVWPTGCGHVQWGGATEKEYSTESHDWVNRYPVMTFLAEPEKPKKELPLPRHEPPPDKNP